jgi:diguanylate cyclase (GGDEF)-like protein/PAS domain S-box-containing protein
LNRTLQELQERLSLAQRASGSGIWDWNIESGRIDWSDELFRLFGLDPATSDAGLDSWGLLIHPDDRPGAETRLSDAIRDHVPLLSEYRIVKPSGEVRWVSAHGDTVYDDQSHPVRMIGICIDITERKQLYAQVIARREQALLQARLSEALLALPEAVEGCDEVSLMQYALSVAEQLTGSRIGFAHMVRADQQQIELLALSKATLESNCSAFYDNHYPISLAGLWADAVRGRVPVVVNDYASAMGKRGPPEGHARLDRLITVPVVESGVVHMLLGVGNKPQYYDETDLETVRLVAGAVWRIVSHRRSDKSLRESQDLLKEAQRIAGVGSYVLDVATGQWESSDELDRLFGIDGSYPRTVQGWKELIHPDDLAQSDDHLRNHVLAQRMPFDLVYRVCRHADKALRWVHGLGRLDLDAQGLPHKMIGTIQDITERKAAEERIHHMAFSDALTDLPNRRLLTDRLQQILLASGRRERLAAVVYVDLDDFKTLNDTSGHDVGDMLLRQVAVRMHSCIREGDTVARLGGDEFIVLLGDLSRNPAEAARQAEAVTEKILAAVSQPYLLSGSQHHCTASIGITLIGDCHENTAEPLKRAELAMYQAKAAGRDTWRFFEPNMQAVVGARAAMEKGLREAISTEQFILHYQPQVNDARQIVGVEALIRWPNPLRGMVSPAEFIPLAEETGLILPLGKWVLETACRQLALWADLPKMAHLMLAVNVSAREFHQGDFVDQVLGTLERTGARADRLKLELTESLLVTRVEEVIAKMNVLKSRGVSFSLDDFGTGYSSLSYLKRLPLEQLKIDQGFVRDILVDANDAAISKMVIALAASMGLEVIAEGVETEDQCRFLTELGCCHYQGYLFSRPLPIDQLEALVNGGQFSLRSAPTQH